MAKKILVIDDDPDILESSRIILESSGFEVITCSGPDEGMESARLNSPDLVILDVMMKEPDDGFFVAAKLKSEMPAIPIIMYSSVSNALGYEFGVNKIVKVERFIDKPVSPEILISAINELINGRKGG